MPIINKSPQKFAKIEIFLMIFSILTISQPIQTVLMMRVDAEQARNFNLPRRGPGLDFREVQGAQKVAAGNVGPPARTHSPSFPAKRRSTPRRKSGKREAAACQGGYTHSIGKRTSGTQRGIPAQTGTSTPQDGTALNTPFPPP